MRGNKGWKKASFTVESAIWIPFLLFLFMGVMELGITLYEKSISRKSSEYLLELEAVELFYDLQILGEMGEKNGV